MPVGIERPIAFHNFRLRTTGNRSAVVERLVESAASLMPSTARSSAPAGDWPSGSDKAGSIGSVDVQAGDDQLVFFTVARPSGLGTSVAFDMECLHDAGPVGWRARDLAQGAYRPAIAAGMASSLEAIAEALTAWGRSDVHTASRLESAAIMGATESGRSAALADLWDHWRAVVWDSERVLRLREAMMAAGHPLIESRVGPALSPSVVAHGTGRRAGLEGSELVLRGHVSLADSLAWYDERTQIWVRTQPGSD